MKIAGVKISDSNLLGLAQQLRLNGAWSTADSLEGSVAAGDHTLHLDVLDREAILRALEDPPAGLEKLRGVLLRESTERRGV